MQVYSANIQLKDGDNCKNITPRVLYKRYMIVRSEYMNASRKDARSHEWKRYLEQVRSDMYDARIAYEELRDKFNAYNHEGRLWFF